MVTQSEADNMSKLREKCAMKNPKGTVTDINAEPLVGEKGVLDRESHVRITHMVYFKPTMHAFSPT